jgi:hypothetical protein
MTEPLYCVDCGAEAAVNCDDCGEPLCIQCAPFCSKCQHEGEEG